MQEPGDPLDLLDDDGNGTVEICLVEEEEKQGKGGTDNRSGCCLIFLVLGSSLLLAGWCLNPMA